MKTRKILALLLAMVMVLGLCSMASAAAPNDKVQINNMMVDASKVDLASFGLSAEEEIELAKRMQSKQSIKNRIRQPKDAYAYIKNKLMFEKQEKVVLLCLNNHLEIVQDKLLFIGSGDVSLLETKEVFQYTLRSGCNRIILIHNHPSGNPKPSHEDQEITRKIEMMAKHLDIEFIDHIIIGDHCYYSFKSNQIYQSKED